MRKRKRSFSFGHHADSPWPLPRAGILQSLLHFRHTHLSELGNQVSRATSYYLSERQPHFRSSRVDEADYS